MKPLKLAIDAAAVEHLLASGVLNAHDFRCLDSDSKWQLRDLFLRRLARRLQSEPEVPKQRPQT